MNMKRRLNELYFKYFYVANVSSWMSVENVTKLEKRMIVKTLYQMCLILYDTPTFTTFSLLPSFLYRALFIW